MKIFLYISAFLLGVVSISRGQLVTVTIDPANGATAVGRAAEFSVLVSSNAYCNGAYTFQWQHAGTNILSNIYLVAGNGTEGYSGVNVLATNAELNDPNGIAVDSAGNLYIADAANNAIRKVDTNGYITTVAGRGLDSGTDGWGDGLQATNASLSNPVSVAVDAAGNIYICDQFHNVIRKVDLWVLANCESIF